LALASQKIFGLGLTLSGLGLGFILMASLTSLLTALPDSYSFLEGGGGRGNVRPPEID